MKIIIAYFILVEISFSQSLVNGVYEQECIGPMTFYYVFDEGNYKYLYCDDTHGYYTEGTYEVDDDEIILNSKTIPNDTLYQISSNQICSQDSFIVNISAVGKLGIPSILFKNNKDEYVFAYTFVDFVEFGVKFRISKHHNIVKAILKDDIYDKEYSFDIDPLSYNYFDLFAYIDIGNSDYHERIFHDNYSLTLYDHNDTSFVVKDYLKFEDFIDCKFVKQNKNIISEDELYRIK